MSVPSVAALIRDFGQKINKRCSLCGEWSLLRIGPAHDGFVVCLICDTNQESRKTANLSEQLP